jgi:hypothetical protein
VGTQVPETPLYHYCGADAFFQIIGKRRLRAGQLSTMNDSAEYTWLFDIARKRMSDRMTGTLLNSSMDEFSVLSETCNLLHEPIESDPYSICLSGEGDLLSQWRAYSDQGRGFSIGFKPVAVKKDLLHTHGPFYLGKVNYDQASHESIVDEAIKEWENAIRKDSAMNAALKLRLRLMQHGPLCKNPAFIEEAEWRFVYSYPLVASLASESDIFDVKNGAIVQYHYADFDHLFDVPDVIEHIYLGPKNPMTPDRRALKAFLHAAGFYGVEVIPSKSTLR